MDARGRALDLFAGLLDYPDGRARETAAELGGGAVPLRPSASLPLLGFREYLARTAPGEIEADYIRAFDFEPATCLYVGHHLFAETSRRGLFLVGLKEAYRRAGFDPGGELPDHLPALLRFLASAAAPEEGRELIEDCLVPVVRDLWVRLTARRHAYAAVFEALLRYLEEAGGEAAGERT